MMASVATPFACPSCSTTLSFKTEIALAQVCPVCQSVIRKASGVGASLQKAQPPKEVMSILRIGTQGKHADASFEVIGLIQYFFTEGYRNHWFILYQNGQTGWLGDWAGNYSFFQSIAPPNTSIFNNHSIGARVKIAEVFLELEVKDKVKEILWQGEVPEQGLHDERCVSMEWYGTRGQLALTHSGGASKPTLYFGQYVELSSLQLTHVRKHHDWV